MAKQEVTISSGAFTITGSYATVNGEGDADDDLDDIDGGVEGQVIVLETEVGMTITITGSGNVNTVAGAFNIIGGLQEYRLTFIHDGTKWQPIAACANNPGV